jgi:hypothetical protein
MYASISQGVSRQHREGIMQGVRAARLAGTARANHEGTSRPLRDLSWEIARYAGLVGKRLRK